MCRVYKASLGDEDEFAALVEDMKFNLHWGGVWSRFPCKCDPPCEIPTEQQMNDFNDRLNDQIRTPKKEEDLS